MKRDFRVTVFVDAAALRKACDALSLTLDDHRVVGDAASFNYKLEYGGLRFSLPEGQSPALDLAVRVAKELGAELERLGFDETRVFFEAIRALWATVDSIDQLGFFQSDYHYSDGSLLSLRQVDTDLDENEDGTSDTLFVTEAHFEGDGFEVSLNVHFRNGHDPSWYAEPGVIENGERFVAWARRPDVFVENHVLIEDWYG
jgi:hypothetical protein